MIATVTIRDHEILNKCCLLERALALMHLHNYAQAMVDVLNARGIISIDQKNYTGSLFFLDRAIAGYR